MVDVKNNKNEFQFTAFLHKSHLDEDISKINKVKVKEINYFEHYPIITALTD